MKGFLKESSQHLQYSMTFAASPPKLSILMITSLGPYKIPAVNPSTPRTEYYLGYVTPDGKWEPHSLFWNEEWVILPASEKYCED